MRGLLLCVLFAIPASAGEKPVSSGNTAFALDLYGKLGTRKGNLFFSPYSISSALAMTWGGARGATAEEMATALRFGKDAEVHAGFEALNKQLLGQNRPGYQLSVANRLFLQRDFPLLDAFTTLTKTRYNAPVEQVGSFADDASRVRINT